MKRNEKKIEIQQIDFAKWISTRRINAGLLKNHSIQQMNTNKPKTMEFKINLFEYNTILQWRVFYVMTNCCSLSLKLSRRHSDQPFVCSFTALKTIVIMAFYKELMWFVSHYTIKTFSIRIITSTILLLIRKIPKWFSYIECNKHPHELPYLKHIQESSTLMDLHFVITHSQHTAWFALDSVDILKWFDQHFNAWAAIFRQQCSEAQKSKIKTFVPCIWAQ